MTPTRASFAPFAARMRRAGLPQIFIDTFACYYDQLVQGHTGLIPESEIEPVSGVQDAEILPACYAEAGREVIGKTAVIKLNGGLGTSMGLTNAKSLLLVKDGLSFLDIIARQAEAAGAPLLLMNSFATDAESLAALAALDGYHPLDPHLPRSFLQHKAPKVTQADFSPINWPDDPELEWCPPGHGDIYTALLTSGALDALLERGYEFAFVANADNLGAVIDHALLGYFAENQFPFMMEVADRTEMDKKGGHLAQRPDGRLILRESAQCPPADEGYFQDIQRHKYFNTNNLWINLRDLHDALAERGGKLGLPMIRNAKTVDPRDPQSTPVYQLETAMGSAIGVFPAAAAVRVPRNRFAPVKQTDDLLVVRSDVYTLTVEQHVVPNPARTLGPLHVALDPAYYRFVSQLDGRFPYGPPSLLHCRRFELTGDFKFGRDVVCRGDVILTNATDAQIVIPDGAVLGD